MGAIKNVLLTGGTGFVGSHVLEALINNGYNVIIIKRHNSNTWRIAHLCENYIAYNIDEADCELDDIFKKHNIDAIIHTATEYGKNALYHQLLQTNVVFPTQLIEKGIQNGTKLFVNTDTFFTKNDKYDYLSQYSFSKNVIKTVLKSFTEKIKVVNMQLEHVYGEKDADGKFVNYIIDKLISDTANIELTDGLQMRDFVYVKDVAESYISILQGFDKLTPFSSYEVGTGSPVSVRAFVEKAATLSNSKVELQFGKIAKREGEFETSYANNQLQQELGWKADTPLEIALLNTINYHRSKQINHT